MTCTTVFLGSVPSFWDMAASAYTTMVLVTTIAENASASADDAHIAASSSAIAAAITRITFFFRPFIAFSLASRAAPRFPARLEFSHQQKGIRIPCCLFNSTPPAHILLK